MTEHIRESNLIESVTDEWEIQQSLEAWDYLIARKSMRLMPILKTHYLIGINLMPKSWLGELRSVYVEVGQRTCPSPESVPYILDMWIEKMQNLEKIDPKTAHIDFEHIHPFRDGNGRTGRMLMWWHEIQLGLEPTIIKYDDRYEYYKWF